MSTKSKPRSIASQLILLFTLAAVLLVAFGLGIFYWLVVRHAFAEDNAVLDKAARRRRKDRRRDPGHEPRALTRGFPAWREIAIDDAKSKRPSRRRQTVFPRCRGRTIQRPALYHSTGAGPYQRRKGGAKFWLSAPDCAALQHVCVEMDRGHCYQTRSAAAGGNHANGASDRADPFKRTRRRDRLAGRASTPGPGVRRHARAA